MPVYRLYASLLMYFSQHAWSVATKDILFNFTCLSLLFRIMFLLTIYLKKVDQLNKQTV